MSEPRTGLSGGQWAVQGALALVLGWLYGLELADWFAARTQTVAAIPSPPSLLLVALALLVLAGGAGLLVDGLRKGRGRDWRGFRLFPIGALVLLFLDFAVLSTTRAGGSSHDIALGVADAVAARATGLSSATHVVSDEVRLKQTLKDLPPVPFLLHGDRAGDWRFDIRRGCAGPAVEVRGQSVGTLIYCIDLAGRTAWVTVVGLPMDQRFGEPGVVTADPELVGTVSPMPTENAPDEVFPEEPGDDVAPFMTPDANR